MQKTIMIIEDSIILSEMCRYKLELEGFRVIIKSDGLAAMEKLEAGEKPDLVLLDLMMPNMNGFEVLERVRELGILKKSKIIVFSNLSEPKDRERCLALGASEFILKASITPKELVVKIRQVLAKK